MDDLNQLNLEQTRYISNPFNRKVREHEDLDDNSVESRTFDVCASSTIPCDRGIYYEVLSHDPSAIDLSLAKRKEGIPLLWAHEIMDRNDKVGSNVLGRFIDPYIDGDKLRGKIVISEVEKDILTKIKEGTISDVSVGYRINDKIVSKDKKPTLTATNWTLKELSLCAIGLDHTVGVGRSVNKDKIKNKNMTEDKNKEVDSSEDKEKMTNKKKMSEDKEKMTNENKRFDVSELDSRVESERKRIDMVYRVADQFNLSNEERTYFIKNNSSTDEIMEKILDSRSNSNQTPMNMGPSDIPSDAKREYTLGGVINALCGNRNAYDAGVALEVSKELERKYNKPLADSQIHVPWGALVGSRTYNVATTNAGNGGQLISTPTLTDQLIEALRPLSILPTLGLNTQTGLTDNFKIPRQNTVSVPTNLATDTSPITETQGTYDFIEFSPHGIGALSKITKQLSYQVPQAESFIRNDLMREIGLRLDQQFFYGSGSGGQVQGLIGLSGVNTVASSANGDNVNAEMLIAGEAAINNQNVMGQAMAIVNTATWGALKALREGSGRNNGAYLWTESRDNSSNFAVASFRGIPIVKSNMLLGNRSKGTGRNLSDFLMGVFNYAYFANWGPGLVFERGWSGTDFDNNVESVKMTTYVDFQYKHLDAFYYRRDVNTPIGA